PASRNRHRPQPLPNNTQTQTHSLAAPTPICLANSLAMTNDSGTAMKAYGVLAALICVSANHAAAAPSVVVTHYEPLQPLTLQPGAPTAQQKINKAAPLTRAVAALARSFELQLEPSDRLLSQATRTSLPSDVAHYRGKLAGK